MILTLPPDTEGEKRLRRPYSSSMDGGGGGRRTGSYYGAWDYLSANVPKEMIDEVLSGYKRGKYLQEDLWQGHERVSVVTRSN